MSATTGGKITLELDEKNRDQDAVTLALKANGVSSVVIEKDCVITVIGNDLNVEEVLRIVRTGRSTPMPCHLWFCLGHFQSHKGVRVKNVVQVSNCNPPPPEAPKAQPNK